MTRNVSRFLLNIADFYFLSFERDFRIYSCFNQVRKRITINYSTASGKNQLRSPVEFVLIQARLSLSKLSDFQPVQFAHGAVSEQGVGQHIDCVCTRTRPGCYVRAAQQDRCRCRYARSTHNYFQKDSFSCCLC